MLLPVQCIHDWDKILRCVEGCICIWFLNVQNEFLFRSLFAFANFIRYYRMSKNEAFKLSVA